MTTMEAGYATGRKAKTYYNTATRANPTWVEITGISKENFDPGEQEFYVAKARELGRDLQEEDSVKPSKLTFTRQVKRGQSDTVHAALLASYGYGGTVYEFAVMDGDITQYGATGWRFFGKAKKMPYGRDIGAFVDQNWEFEEVVHFESNALCELLAHTVSAPTTTTAAPTTTTTPG